MVYGTISNNNMYLKLRYNNEIKKIPFKPEYRNRSALLQLCENVTGWSAQQLQLKFKDIEGDELSILTDDDMEYFVVQNNNTSFKEIDIIYSDKGTLANGTSQAGPGSMAISKSTGLVRIRTGRSAIY